MSLQHPRPQGNRQRRISEPHRVRLEKFIERTKSVRRAALMLRSTDITLEIAASGGHLIERTATRIELAIETYVREVTP